MYYELQPNGTYTPHGGGFGGAMQGTWSITLHNPGLGYSLVMISNNSGNFDGLVPRMEAITDSFDANPCGFALDDPRVNPAGPHYIQNVHEQERYLNTETGLGASNISRHWLSAGWTLEPVDGTYFRIRDWQGNYLHVEFGSLQAGFAEPFWWSAMWVLEPVGDGFRIRNRWQGDQYLNIESGQLSSSAISPGWLSAQWQFCD